MSDLAAVLPSYRLPTAWAIDNPFVDELPGDSEAGNFTRQVMSACYSAVCPTPTRAPKLLAVSRSLAADLHLHESDWQAPSFAAVMSGNGLYQGMKPFASCYGGHQFGHWAGQLGDGRAISLGDVAFANASHAKPRRAAYHLQLKGAGATPYSRHADGRAVLRSSIREFLCSEAMHHLGIATTRALSLCLTGDGVERDMMYDGHAEIEPGAVVCRVAPSFIRFGHFQIFAMRNDISTLEKLLTHTLEQHFPDLFTLFKTAPVEAVVAFFHRVMLSSCDMVVQWMRVGFVHGVMNTDNMSILGQTIDYGPYGWLDNYDPNWTPNTTDAQMRRYRFANQPAMVQWNLMQLANALYPLVNQAKPLEDVLYAYDVFYQQQYESMMLAKLGLASADMADQTRSALIQPLIQECCRLMTDCQFDMTHFFQILAQIKQHGTVLFSEPARSGSDTADINDLVEAALALLLPCSYLPSLTSEQSTALREWVQQWLRLSVTARASLAEQLALMAANNPVFVLRNYVSQQVIDAAAKEDYEPLYQVLNMLEKPYDKCYLNHAFAAMRPAWALNKAGCSMLSCSS